MIKAHVRPDGTKLLEGVRGLAVQTLPGNIAGIAALFAGGWVATQDMLDNYWLWEEFADGTILPPSLKLDLPRFLLFVDLANIETIYDTIVPWAKAHASSTLRLAGHILEHDSEFDFDQTMALFSAVAVANSHASAGNFTNTTVLAAYRTAWDVAAFLPRP